MEIKKRQPDLEVVFNQRWNANNYNQNGIKKAIDFNKEHFNKMYNIKPKDQQRKEILEANSVNGKVANLEEKMKAAGAFTNNSKYNNNQYR